jgi:membrane-associated protease RseP (regulator of RpoE activity)
MCGYLSLGVAVWTLMPVPTLDGWILWKAVLARFRR